MGAFAAQRDQEKPKIAHDYRITTVIRDDSLPSIPSKTFVEILDKAIYKTSASYPAVTHYLVKLNDPEILVGLQIENVAPGNVENIANALLQESIDLVMDTLDIESPPEVEESELYLV